MRKSIVWLLASLALLSCSKNTVTVKCSDGSAVRLKVVSPEIVRVTVSPDGKFNDRKSLAVLPQ